MKSFKFNSKQQIIDLIRQTDNYQETQELINEFKELKKQRHSFCMKRQDFDKILKWKLRQQYKIQKRNWDQNTDEIVRKVTYTVFEIQHPDFHYETELKLKILTSLKGVGITVASAILALCYPEKYAVVDFRTFRQLFEKTKLPL